LKTVLWDWNGTLLDDVWTGTEAMNVLLKKYNKPLLRDTEEYREVFCFPFIAAGHLSEKYKLYAARFSAFFADSDAPPLRAPTPPNKNRPLPFPNQMPPFTPLTTAPKPNAAFHAFNHRS